jgi:hypothetical protein
MEINVLTQQIRAAMVAGMGQDMVLAYIEKHYPDLSPDVKVELMDRLTSITIPDKGGGDATSIGPEAHIKTFRLHSSAPEEPPDDGVDIADKDGGDAT